MNEMLRDLSEYRENIKKRLDEIETEITLTLFEDNIEKLLELSDVMERTVEYYRMVEKEIEKMEEYFEVR